MSHPHSQPGSCGQMSKPRAVEPLAELSTRELQLRSRVDAALLATRVGLGAHGSQ